MDLNFNRPEMCVEESFLLYSIPPTPVLVSNYFVASRDCVLQYKSCQSPEDVPQILSCSLMLNELKELEECGEVCEDEPFLVNSQTRICLNGRQFYGLLNWESQSLFLEKQESTLSTLTAVSNAIKFKEDNSHSNMLDSLALVDMRRILAGQNQLEIPDVQAEKLHRRMVTFSLNRFNSFSWTSPLTNKSKPEIVSELNTVKLSKKIIKKNQKPKSRTKKSKDQKFKNSGSLLDSTSCANSLSRSAMMQFDQSTASLSKQITSSLVDGHKELSLDISFDKTASVLNVETIDELPA